MHEIFVLDKNGKPLIPTTSSKAKKLLKKGLAEKVWSKFGTFGVKLLFNIESKENENQVTSLGYDPGTKFEGFSVVCGIENVLNVKLDLPEKWKIKEKMKIRKNCRKGRRFRKCRRRPVRFNNRAGIGFIPASQEVLIFSRLKILNEVFRLFPVSVCAVENAKFNQNIRKIRNRASTVEIGKTRIYNFLMKNCAVEKFQGYETKVLREKYGYKKISAKSANVFESHNCDSLSLAIEVNNGFRLEPCKITVVDDTYRSERRSLHKQLFSKGGIRKLYSKGTVKGIRKGKIVGYKGLKYVLTGSRSNLYRIGYVENASKRNQVAKLDYISSQFKIIQHVD